MRIATAGLLTLGLLVGSMAFGNDTQAKSSVSSTYKTTNQGKTGSYKYLKFTKLYLPSSPTAKQKKLDKQASAKVTETLKHEATNMEARDSKDWKNCSNKASTKSKFYHKMSTTVTKDTKSTLIVRITFNKSIYEGSKGRTHKKTIEFDKTTGEFRTVAFN